MLTENERKKVIEEITEIFEISVEVANIANKKGIFRFTSNDKEKRIVVLAVAKFVQEQYNRVF